MTRIDPSGRLEPIVDTGGGPNGLAVDGEGRLVIANNGGLGHATKRPGELQRWDQDSGLESLAAGLDAPNDVCIGPDGAIWFTDPRVNWYSDDRRPGRIYRWQDELTLVHEGLQFPNGIGFDRNGRLVVAESRSGLLHLVIDGRTEPWAACPIGAPDGFCFDTAGRCYVCCFDAHRVFTFDEGGSLVGTLEIEADAMPTNCTIAASGELLVAESAKGRLLAFDLDLRPLMEPR